MSLTQRLQLRQGQTLVMTPQLQQAIKLLQLSNVELAAFVEQELERNPLLERDEAGAADQPEGNPKIAQTADTSAAAAEGTSDASERDDASEREDASDRDGSNAGSTESTWKNAGAGASFGAGEALPESALAAKLTLKDHLVVQLSIAGLTPDKRMIGLALIDAVDEAGYFRADLSEIASRLGAPEPLVVDVLHLLQGFDPAGVAARDVAECLRLQLMARDRLDPAMDAMLSHLDLVARRDVAALSGVCKVDVEDVSDMLEEVRALTPKPGLAFGGEPVQPVVPDVFVREAQDGTWLVELNSEMLPKLLVNTRYAASVPAKAKSIDLQVFLADCLASANWLVKALDQRARTILKVASEIVRQQDAFFAHGVRHLRPLNLKTVADAISMHESTVSRVTSNKYMATPRGVFELKFFFTASIGSVDGKDVHSAESVRDRIREMIANESSLDILSDDRIVAQLTGDGIDIARRTVAKYREAMRIPSSVERRRLKSAGFTKSVR